MTKATPDQIRKIQKTLKAAGLLTESRYDDDFHAWALDQAQRLRAGEPVDAGHIAEELESLGKNQQRELKSRIAEIIEHLLKLRFLPDHLREPNARGWKVSVAKQRIAVGQLLKQSPSLRRLLTDDFLVECYQDGLQQFTITDYEMLGSAPKSCVFTWEEILDE